MERFDHYVDGAFVPADTYARNVNPSDLSEVVGESAEGGAEVVCGGERLSLETEGYYLSPALFVNTSSDMRINREEIFGPIASVLRVKDYDVKAGMVMVNLPTAGVDYHVPFGGRKGSSYGPREQGRHAEEFYTTVKTTYLSATA